MYSPSRGFTLIELMIVIAIIAIIAAIAIPNLLESRITANESAAAASLKSGFHAGQTQFQAGSYSDVDGDGRGSYAKDHRFLAGATGSSANVGETTRALTLISPTFNTTEGTAVGAYKYQINLQTATASEDLAESFWAAFTVPGSAGNDGRRAFAINVAGVVFATKQSIATADLVLSTVAGNTYMFATDPTTSNPANNTTNAAPYQK